MSPLEELEDIVVKSIVCDIYRMERAYHLIFTIGENSNQLNDKRFGNYGELFGTFQSALEVDAALAVSRIFDRPYYQYEVRCLRQALDIITENPNDFSLLKEPLILKQNLVTMPETEKMILLIKEQPEAFAAEFVRYFNQRINSPENKEKIRALKDLRYKRLAHNENASIVGPSWEGLSDLITLAQQFVGIIGWAYFSNDFMYKGQYTLSDDAKRPMIALQRLAKKITLG